MVELSTLCHANGRFVPLKVQTAERDRQRERGARIAQKKEVESDTKYDTQMLWKNEAMRSYRSETMANHDAGHGCALCAVRIIFNLLHLEA